MKIFAFFLFGLLLRGQVIATEPLRESGNSVTGAFEGWFKNPDGTFSLLLGYYNRNQKQELDIPVGPENRIEPGGPDRGQPTHFMPGRGWGQFVVKVPADFGEGKITWTLTANGKTTVISAHLKAEYELSPFKEASVGNTPPVIRIGDQSVQGPQGIIVEQAARVGVPLAVTAVVADDAKFTSNSGARPKVMPPPVVLHWNQYRGPARVEISDRLPRVEGSINMAGTISMFGGTATTKVTFPQPGEYMLHVQANDYSGPGGSGFQCCWSNAMVRVKVE